jgi:squalene cyclase
MITDAMNSAVDFLLATRSPDGFWRDFWTPAGTSDAWVTGYVGAVLATSPLQKGCTTALEVWSLLRSHRPVDEGWGYGPGVPVDSDSTAWILLLAELVGQGHEERAQRARELLERHVVEGGISTYSPAQADALHHFLQLPAEVDLSAWFLPHTCVTAAVAGLSEFRTQLTDALLNAQQDDGSWACYWWFEPAYATALAVKALAIRGGSPALQAIERAMSWARSRTHALQKRPTPFELAWLLRILLLDGGLSAEASRCLDLLLSLQEANGAWRGSARLRIPRPDEPHPDRVEQWIRWFGTTGAAQNPEETLRRTFTIFSIDQRGIFTTATVLAALQEAARMY